MPYVINTTIVVRLDGSPSHVTASWEAPDGTRRVVCEELDAGCTIEEAERCIAFIREAVEADPF